MARHYLITRARTATGPLFPGTVLDDAQDPVAQIQASGARTYPAPDAVLAAAAARCEELRLRGESAERAEALMLEAAARAGAAAAAPARPVPWVRVPVSDPFGAPPNTGYALGTKLEADFALRADGVEVVAEGGSGVGVTFDLVYLDAAGSPHAVATVTVAGLFPAGSRVTPAGTNSATTIPAGSIVAVDLSTLVDPDPTGFAAYLIRA